jgi:putative membrane-bound dehydrogenase-like protein
MPATSRPETSKSRNNPIALLGLLAQFLSGAASAAPFPAPANNQEEIQPLLTPAEALSRLRLPAGFKATLFAAEPDVRQPIALCWDERGRLWVAENYTYSDSKERFDTTLRDRILIFEDSDNDGCFDKRSVFSDDLQMLTSIERGFGGVWALCPPRLLFIPTEGDQPSGPVQVVLDGFSNTAASRHTFANGLKWGPDGWLYGRVGISSTSWIDTPGVPKEKRQPTAGGVWRYHPVTRIFEPYCHGTTNPWGSDWTKDHELLFINTVIGHAWQGIHGAHFKRMHGQDPYPFVYELIDQHADHYHWDTGKKWNDANGGRGGAEVFGGGHAHVGLMIYRGDQWPAAYRDKLFTLNLHGRRANVESIEHLGSAVVLKHQPDFLTSDDVWFRGVEISQGPDGSAFLLDWSDIGECHENDGVHRSSGRIYKITFGKSAAPARQIAQCTPEELVELQRSSNEWLVRMARSELRERAWRGLDLSTAFLSWEKLAAESDPALALNAHSTLLALRSVAAGKKPLGAQQARHYSPAALVAEKRPEVLARLIERELIESLVIQNHIREKFPSRTGEIDPRAAAEREATLFQLAAEPRGQRVRLALAEALPHLDPEPRSVLAQHLLRYEQDATDHNLPLLVWTGIRELPPSELVHCAHVSRVPQVTKLIARRIAEAADKEPEVLNNFLKSLGERADARFEILAGMNEALRGLRKAHKPAAWDRFIDSIPETDTTAWEQIRRLNVVFGDGQALGEIRRIALDDRAPIEQRRTALLALIDASDTELKTVCESLLSTRGLIMEAIRGLTRFDQDDVSQRIIGRYLSLEPHERPQAIMALVSRPRYAMELLSAVERGSIPRADLGSAAARQMRALNDKALSERLVSVWGETRETPAAKLNLSAELRERHTPELLAKADQSRGRALFATLCSQCHMLYGEGNPLGPELTGSGRHDLNYLLENIVDPNGVVDAAYFLTTLTLKDGRVLSGVVGNQGERTLVLKSIGQENLIDKGEIRSRQTLPISLMPEGLLQALTPEQQRDLLAYLMGSVQVPLPR